MIKTAFLLAQITAKRCSQIHALAVDANHLRFNQSDGSVSLIVQTGFLAKNQIQSICPDPIVIPNLARTCKREHLDRLLCPIRASKVYFKVTSSYRQNRTRLFLPIIGKHDVSKASVLRWVAYTIKLPASVARMHHQTRDQEVAGSIPTEVSNILSWRLIMKYFLRSFSPFR